MQIGFFGVLTLILITLKLMGIIACSWFWVLFPLFIPPILWLVIVVFAVIINNK